MVRSCLLACLLCFAAMALPAMARTPQLVTCSPTGLAAKPRAWTPGVECRGDVTTYRRLRWRGWGSRTARATGLAFVCVGQGCDRYPTRIRATRLRRCRAGGQRVRVYTRVTIREQRDGEVVRYSWVNRCSDIAAARTPG